MPLSGSGLPLQEITAKLSADELVKRLKACSKYLADCDSVDDAISPHLVKLASTLVQSFLQHHRSREVRTLAACCVADIFRVFFPDPPYDDEQLKTAFSMFVSQLQGLETPSAPAFRSSFQLLECLASIKVFNLCLTLDATDIVGDLFKMLFSIINDEQSTKVKMYMADILASLVQEAESLSQEVVDAILVNIVEPNKTENKSAYTFTVEFIRRNSYYLEPFIQLFFNNALVVGKSSESEVADHLYELILELHTIDSSVLLAVLPQLEFKLKSSDAEERLEVTRLLARMFSPRDSKLARENRPLWNCFIGRFGDINPSVRVECVKYSKYFLVYHPDLVQDTTAKLLERFYDKEEKVRMEVVKAISEAASDNMQSVPDSLLDALQERRRDRSWSIRKEALTNIARLYRQAMSSSFSSGVPLRTADMKLVSWIPNKILYSYYQETNEDKLCVERCLLSCIIPIMMKEDEKVERLIHVYTSLDENATRAFDGMLRTRHQVLTHLLGLIQTYEDKETKSEKRERQMLTKIILLARNLPDPVKSQAHLQDLASMLDGDSLREHLKRSVDAELSCQEVMKAKADVVNKLGSKPAVLDTVRALLDHCCPLLVDAHCINMMVERVCSELCEPSLSQSEEEEKVEFQRAKKAIKLIKILAGLLPRHFGHSEVFERFIALLRHEDKEIACDILQILELIGEFIDQSATGCLQPVLTQLAQKGPPELAKHTVRCIHSVFREPKPILQRLFTILTTHLDYDHDHLHTTLISLGQIAKLQPAMFETKHKLIIRDFVVKKLLVTDRAEQEYQEGAAEWCEDDQVSYEARTKVLGMKLLVCWLLGLQADHEKSSHPVLRLLDTVLAHDGDLQGDDNISAPDRSRLRLVAACGLLKLAQNSHYQELISVEQFQRLALTVQDTCEQVRDRFVHKLNKGLKSLRLPLGYLSFFALAGIEPRKEIRTQTYQMMVSSVEKRRACLKQHSRAKENPHAILPEYALAHTVYLLAHHPEFSRTNPQALDNFKDCLWFFLEPVVRRSDNYGFIRKLLEYIRWTVDAQDPTNSESNKNLYAVCDLATGVLTSKLTHIKIGDFPGDVLLPARLFKSKGKDAQLSDVKYLPPGYDCTPTKRALRTESLLVASPNVTAAEEETPGKAVKSPRAKVTKSKTPTKAKSAKGRSPRQSRTTKGKGQQTSKSPLKKTQVASVKDDSGVSDVEEKTEEEEMEVSMPVTTPSRTKKRGRTATQPSRRVRRKVLQEEAVDSTDEEEEEKEQPPKSKGKMKEAEIPRKPTQQARPPTRMRNAKRKPQEDEEKEFAASIVNHATSEPQSKVEGLASPKKRKGQHEASHGAVPQPSISVKRKVRRRR